MYKKKLLSLATVTGLALGGLSIGSVAAAQSYGDEPETSVEEPASTDTESLQDEGIVLVQDDDADTDAAPDDDADTDTDAASEADGERNGRRGHDKDCDEENAENDAENDATSADAEATSAT